ncbi:dipeptide/oligopeptide/nickel ABC transporter ATP-binding protein [Pseudonocardia nigra]|uniref:dipeptide/oligopeptide/nickel ABC transporter ATP-binding protein n=1 Tax=Pseudonocardia nigra TaxID=1921578 RepID=UPI0027E22498|nr:dipeptide/oligopeptide/nickel ABC transporter ATP-binding protein [Pseudonocardia nigra]
MDFDLHRGETLGVVGESRCGKSSLARAVLQGPPPTAGTVRFEGTDLTVLSREQMRAVRPRLQMVFQDPISSLNPRRRVRDIVAEPLDIWQLGDPRERRTRVADVLADVGLDHDTVADRRPGELSGGKCQRVSLGRALVLNPHVIVCDEVLSALDVSVQAQILNRKLCEIGSADGVEERRGLRGDRHRSVEQPRGQRRDPVERAVGWGIEVGVVAHRQNPVRSVECVTPRWSPLVWPSIAWARH